MQSLWITKGIRRSSKHKQRLYEKFLKNQNKKNELEYENYKHLFEAVKKRPKKLHFSELILRYKNNIKKTWKVIKERIGKKKYGHENFPRKLVINKKDITNTDFFAENLNKYFSDIGPKLAKNIEVSSIDFRSYFKEHETVQSECDLTVNELKEAFFSLKINKSSGYDRFSFNVVKNCFGSLIKALMNIFNLSLAKGIFPDNLKSARVTPVFKAGNENEVRNYRSISILSCFSKILERIMYNRLFKYLTIWFSGGALYGTCYNATN